MTAITKLKAAVIGCGYAGMADHIPWYSAHADVDVVALVDSDLARAEACTGRWEGRPYENVAAMLEAEEPKSSAWQPRCRCTAAMRWSA